MRKMMPYVIALCAIVLCVLASREIYLYNNPEIIISYSKEEGEDLYRSLPVYAINPKSRFGQAKRYDKEMKDWWETTNEVNEWLHFELVTPMNITSRFWSRNSKKATILKSFVRISGV